ncbi:MAG: extracellular solute-binding protein [Chitinophagaceae bacterium]|nr:extracellular solute-binding protein [Chitinophagaceae bacterium]
MSFTKIDYTPLYLKVKDVITQRIVDGTYAPGKLIPSEADFAREFGLSISTVRQALSILVSEGALDKKQGKGTSVTNRKTPVRFLTWYPEFSEGKRIMYGLVELINANLPSIEVQIVPSTYVTLKKDLINYISNGNCPDLIQLPTFWTSYFSSMGAFEPLDELVSKENISARGYETDLAGGVIDKKIYSLAMGLCPMALVCNNSLLQKAAVKIPAHPLSMREFSLVCTQIDAVLGEKQYSYGLVASKDELDFLCIYPLLTAFGGGFDVKGGKNLLDTKENIKAFTWIREFVNSHKTFRSDIFTIRKLFAKGDIAIFPDGPWIKPQMAQHSMKHFESNYTILLNPGTSGISTSWQSNHSLAISSQSPHKKAAAKVIEVITGNNKISEYFYGETGVLPVNKHQRVAAPFNTAFGKTFRKQLEHSSVLNARNPMFEKAMLLCKNAVHRILFEKADITAELAEKEYYLKMIYYE